MPRRLIVLANGEYYHVYNRSVGKEGIFVAKKHLNRAFHLAEYYRYPASLSYSKYMSLGEKEFDLYTIRHYSQKPLVTIHAFCFMYNHYHFVLKQVRTNGIKTFLTDFQNGFAKYFNITTDRHGTVFGSRFQAAYIENEDTFFHIVRYIELNPVTSYLIAKGLLSSYVASSYMYRYGSDELAFLDNSLVYGRFTQAKDYEEFIFNQAEYQQNLKWIKKAIKE